MLKFGKYVSVFLAIIMLLSIGCVGAAAGDDDTPIEVGPHPGQEVSTKTYLSEDDYETIIDEMIQTRIGTYTPSEEDFARAQEIIDLYNEITPVIRNSATVLFGLDIITNSVTANAMYTLQAY